MIIDLTNRLDDMELLLMREQPPIYDCRRCLGTGMRIDPVYSGESVIGISAAMNEPCACCGGLGIHFHSQEN